MINAICINRRRVATSRLVEAMAATSALAIGDTTPAMLKDNAQGIVPAQHFTFDRYTLPFRAEARAHDSDSILGNNVDDSS